MSAATLLIVRCEYGAQVNAVLEYLRAKFPECEFAARGPGYRREFISVVESTCDDRRFMQVRFAGEAFVEGWLAGSRAELKVANM